MAYFNFEIPSTGKQYSVDFTVYSNQYHISGTGYKVLPVTDTALDGATVYDTADDWATGNAAILTATSSDSTSEQENSGS